MHYSGQAQRAVEHVDGVRADEIRLSVEVGPDRPYRNRRVGDEVSNLESWRDAIVDNGRPEDRRHSIDRYDRIHQPRRAGACDGVEHHGRVDIDQRGKDLPEGNVAVVRHDPGKKVPTAAAFTDERVCEVAGIPHERRVMEGQRYQVDGDTLLCIHQRLERTPSLRKDAQRIGGGRGRNRRVLPEEMGLRRSGRQVLPPQRSKVLERERLAGRRRGGVHGIDAVRRANGQARRGPARCADELRTIGEIEPLNFFDEAAVVGIGLGLHGLDDEVRQRVPAGLDPATHVHDGDVGTTRVGDHYHVGVGSEGIHRPEGDTPGPRTDGNRSPEGPRGDVEDFELIPLPVREVDLTRSAQVAVHNGVGHQPAVG